jgi:hypothetical protein
MAVLPSFFKQPAHQRTVLAAGIESVINPVLQGHSVVLLRFRSRRELILFVRFEQGLDQRAALGSAAKPSAVTGLIALRPHLPRTRLPPPFLLPAVAACLGRSRPRS